MTSAEDVTVVFFTSIHLNSIWTSLPRKAIDELPSRPPSRSRMGQVSLIWKCTAYWQGVNETPHPHRLPRLTSRKQNRQNDRCFLYLRRSCNSLFVSGCSIMHRSVTAFLVYYTYSTRHVSRKPFSHHKHNHLNSMLPLLLLSSSSLSVPMCRDLDGDHYRSLVTPIFKRIKTSSLSKHHCRNTIGKS